MLTHLSIRNYALIDNLTIDFPNGLITITGETGAGKSIILGALKLVLGERAEIKSIKNSEKKCFIEADFQLSSGQFANFFIQNDLDFEENTVIRREILPSGKSRAFINDTPVTLDTLHELTYQLIDIHSQFETSDLYNENYQMGLLDKFSGLEIQFSKYISIYNQYILEKKKLEELIKQFDSNNNDSEYNKYLWEELENAELESLSFSDLENELNMMKNSEFIAHIISESQQLLQNEDIGTLNQLQEISSRMDKGAVLLSDLEKLAERINSVKLELQDITSEYDLLLEKLEFNPIRFEELNQKFNEINTLLQKHKVNSVDELLEIKNHLLKKTTNSENLEKEISISQKQIQKYINELNLHATELHNKRLENIPFLEKRILEILTKLGMDKSKINIKLETINHFNGLGSDKISFLFSANMGKKLLPIEKSISGGERSRVMLAIKKIMAENDNLPTLILDEIDTGVSGRIANEIGILMQEMSKTMQLIVITHLPQVAAKGNYQFKVEKNEVENKTQTQIRLLTPKERIEEIAQLISGSDVTDIARAQAQSLLN